MSKIRKKIGIVVSVILGVAIIAGLIFGGLELKVWTQKNNIKFEEYTEARGTDKIHFISVGSSDAILLESNGKFALIDCAEDSENSRGFSGLELKGYEQVVVDYLNKVCAKDGQIELDFVVGTHAHSDHIGGFDTLISQNNVNIKRAYLKRYYADRINNYEVEEWDNTEVYNQMVDALKEKNVPLIQDLNSEKITFENMQVTLLNTKEAEEGKKVGENENSLAVLVESGGIKVLLAGDMNNIDGDEVRIAQEIGTIDVLKLGHHGYENSSTKKFIDMIEPKVAIQTTANLPHSDVKYAVSIANSCPIFSSVKYNGIIMEFGKEIKFYKNANNII